MTIYGVSDLSWKGNSLQLGKEILISIEEHSIHKNMFYLKWPDDTKSLDFYNLSRAKDNCYQECLNVLNNPT